MTTQMPMPQAPVPQHPVHNDWQAVKSRLLSSPVLLCTTLCLVILGFILLLGAILVAVNSVVFGPWVDSDGYGYGAGGHFLLGIIFGILGIGCIVSAVAIAFSAGRQPRLYDYGMPSQYPAPSDPSAFQSPS